MQLTKTTLDISVVGAIVESAYRLLPPDNSPKGIEERKKIQKRKAEEALQAENNFLGFLKGSGYQFHREAEQKKSMSRVTPDARFLSPILTNGQLCHWIEFKTTLAFVRTRLLRRKRKDKPDGMFQRLALVQWYTSLVSKMNISGSRVLRFSVKRNYL